jgi:hypothetical protein
VRHQPRDVPAGGNTGLRLVGNLDRRAILALQPVTPGLSPDLDELLPEDQPLNLVGVRCQIPNTQLQKLLAGIAEEPAGRLVLRLRICPRHPQPGWPQAMPAPN